MARKNPQQGSNPNIERQLANNEQSLIARGFTEKTILPSGQTAYMKPQTVQESYGKMVGGGGGGGSIKPNLADLDKLFSYQGVQYGDLPSYKVGQKGGSLGLDRLAMMMGGQIYNPYQFARMTSSGGASGEYPYKSALSEQEAGQEKGLQGMRGEQELGLQRLRGEQEVGLQRLRGEQEIGLRGIQKTNEQKSNLRDQISKHEQELQQVYNMPVTTYAEQSYRTRRIAELQSAIQGANSKLRDIETWEKF